MNIRTQASLYLVDVPKVESIRRRFNPAQARLIPAHVTLCREDEAESWHGLCERIQSLCPFELTLEFGAPIRNGNFVYLPPQTGEEDFHRLRCDLLDAPVRRQDPHLTLIHPRNGICDEAVFAEIHKTIRPFTHTFHHIEIIEQAKGGVWNIRRRINTVTGQSIDV
jgi:hypothetical protein